MNDHALLEAYARNGSQSAFGELVDRHIGLVYSAARRRLGDPHLAEDVTQQVFALLAHKAGQLTPPVILAGWLYRTAIQMASQTLRGESRRHHREQLTVAMNTADPQHTVPDLAWQQIEPHLDEAMASLASTDRDAVVLRFFQNKSLRDVGAALGVSDDAAQKRLSRALEKLRIYFQRRGKTIATGSLAAALSAGAIQAAPAGLGASVATAVFAGSIVITPASTALTFMSWTTVKSIALGAAALGAAGVIALEHQQLNTVKGANLALTQRLRAAESNTALLRLAPTPATTALDASQKAELLRLRSEVNSLRQLRTKLTAENSRLRAEGQTKASANPDEEQPDPQRTAARRMAIAKLNYAKAWGIALQTYAQDHNNGRLPDSLDPAVPYFPSLTRDSDDPDAPTEEDYVAFQPDQYELMYRGSFSDIKQPNKTIILREKQLVPSPSGDGFVRAYLFADGHSEIHFVHDTNPDPWEREHLVPPNSSP